MTPQRGVSLKSNVFIILLICCLMYLALNYWRVSTSNMELAREISRMESIIHMTEDKWQRVEQERLIVSEKVVKCNSENLVLQTEMNAKGSRISELSKEITQLKANVYSLSQNPSKIKGLEHEVEETSSRLSEANIQISDITAKLGEANEMNLFLKKQLIELNSSFEDAKRDSSKQLEELQLKLSQCSGEKLRPIIKNSEESSEAPVKHSISIERSENDGREFLSDNSVESPAESNNKVKPIIPPAPEKHVKLSATPENLRRSNVQVMSHGMGGVLHHNNPVLLFDPPDSPRPGPRFSVTQL